MRPTALAFVVTLATVVVVGGCEESHLNDKPATAKPQDAFDPGRHLQVRVSEVPYRGRADAECHVRASIVNCWTKPIYYDKDTALSHKKFEYQLEPMGDGSSRWRASGPMMVHADAWTPRNDRIVCLRPGETGDVDTYVRLSEHAPVVCVDIGLRIGQSEAELGHTVRWKAVILVDGGATSLVSGGYGSSVHAVTGTERTPSQEVARIDEFVRQVRRARTPPRRINVVSGTDSESFAVTYGTAAKPLRVRLRIGLSAEAVDHDLYLEDGRLVCAGIVVALYPLGEEGHIYDDSRLTEVSAEWFYFREGALLSHVLTGRSITDPDGLGAEGLKELAAHLVGHWSDTELDIEAWIKDGRFESPKD